MKMTNAVDLLLFFCTGLILGFSFLFPGTVLGAVLAWIFCLLLALLASDERRSGAIKFFAAGFAVQLTVFHWLPQTISRYGEFSMPVAVLLGILYCLVASLPLAFSGLVYSRLLLRLPRYYALPLAWLAAESLIPVFIPWSLSHTQIPFQELAGGADLLGAPFLSALMLFWCAAIIELSGSRARTMKPKRFARYTLASMLAVWAYSTYRQQILSREIRQSAPLSIGIIQPNFNPAKDFRPDKLTAAIDFERELSLRLVQMEELDLLAWPESSIWFDIPDSTKGIRRGGKNDPFAGLSMPIILGGESSISVPTGERPKLRNSVFLFDRTGAIAGRYHKRILFPFSERIPLAGIFPVLERLNRKDYSVPAGDDRQDPIRLTVEKAPNERSVTLATAICYEDMWPQAFSDQIHAGAGVLFSFSNDAWFLRSVAVAQHHLLARWRAIEFRRYLVRVTMDGVTAVVDPFGRVVEGLPSFVPASFVSKEVRPITSRSFYSSVGDIPLRLLAFTAVIAAIWRRSAESDHS